MRLTRLICLFFVAVSCCVPALAEEPVLDFLEGLRQRGYYDTAVEYLELVESNPNLPADVKAIIPYERAQILLSNASQLKNLNDQRKQLDASQAAFEAFVKANPNHRLAGRANSARGKILLEQARVEIWDGDKPSNEGNRDLFRKNARDMITRAQQIFKQAVDQHAKVVASFPTFIPQENKKQIEERDKADAEHIESQLNFVLCDYWRAQTYDRGTTQRKEILDQAALDFEEIHSANRTWLGGLYARLYQGKCFEEQDDIRRALGIYEELLGHDAKSTTLIDLRDKVLRFRLICLNHEKRKDYKLAILEGEDWLRDAKTRSRTNTGLGIQWEVSRAYEILAQDRTTPEDQKNEYLTKALNRARTISRFPGELKTLATMMIQRILVSLDRDPGDPKDFETASGNGNVLFQEVNTLNAEIRSLLSEGKKKEAAAKKETVIASGAEMARQFDIALKLVRPDTDPILVNNAMLRLAYGYLVQEKFFDSAVVAGHLMQKFGEKHPEFGREAGFIAMSAYEYAYTTSDEDERRFEGEMIKQIAEKIAERWPESDRANDARNVVAKILFQEGDLLNSADWYLKIPQGTSGYAQAQVTAGKAYWRQYIIEASKPENERPAAEDLNTWKAAAIKHLETGLNIAQKEVPADKTLPDDLVGAKLTLINIRNLDGLYTQAEGGPPGALELLTADPHPVLKAVDVPEGQTRPTDPTKAQSRELASFAYQQLLRAQIGLRNLEEARNARTKLEEVAGKEDAAALTQVYVEFGRELEQELERLKAANETERLADVRAGFESFLGDLYNREEGQTFYSLLWIAETYTSLADGSRDDAAKSIEYFGRAADAYQKILTNAANDASFVSDPSQVLATKLRLAISLRRKPDFAGAETVILDILKTNPNALDAQVEVASLYQEWASSGELGASDKFLVAIKGSNKDDPVAIWGWAKIAQNIQMQLFSRHDDRLEQIHFDARLHLAETQLQWSRTLSDEDKALEQLRRAQASVVGFQRTSKRWPDEQYERFNALYREILTDLGSPVVDLPRELDGGGGTKTQIAGKGPGTQPENPQPDALEPEAGGSNAFLIILMLFFGGGAVVGLYFMAVGQNKKKYAKYQTSGTPKVASAKEETPKLEFPPEIAGEAAATVSTSPGAQTTKTKRKPTEEEIKKIKAARAAKAAKLKAAQQKQAGGAGAPEKKRKPKPE